MTPAKRSAKKKLDVAFLMDPIESIDLETDTTFVLMLETQKRGHRLFYLEPESLRVEKGGPRGLMARVKVKRPTSAKVSHYSLAGPEDRELSSMDLVFNRLDPPYTIDYVTVLQMLAMIQPPTMVINRPRGVLLANEKLLAMRFPELMPPTIVTRDMERLRAFLHKVRGKMVVKPLAAFGGEGVFVVEKSHTNAGVIIETMTRNGTRQVVAQEFMPVTSKGDKRIMLLAGEPIGAVLRKPAKGDHRANLHAGGTWHKTTLTPKDLEICAALGPWLRREGLFLAGIDEVAGKLTEINVTSPTLVQQINRLDGVKLEERIIEFSEYLADTAKNIKA